jgi:hypothetical protein
MRGALIGLLAVACGCLAAPAAERGVPLYAAGPAPLPPGQVAILNIRVPEGTWLGTGSRPHIKSVDGRDVTAQWPPFELLPGCHVVETVGPWTAAHGTDSNRRDGWARVFALRMRAGLTYTVLMDDLVYPYVSVRAVVWDPVGAQEREIPAARGDADVEACRAWTAPPVERP